MDSYIVICIGLHLAPLIVIAAWFAFLGPLIKRRRDARQNKKQDDMIEFFPSSVEMWATQWLAERRGLYQTVISREVPISPKEVEEGVAEAIERFGSRLLRRTNIETLGEFIDMIESQHQHRGQRKKAANG